MWIFTTKGFISAVQWKDKPSFMCVRARAREHLAALFPEAEIIEMPDADYRYRAKVSRTFFEQSMLYELRAISYPDFKSELEHDAYHAACSRVWEVMRAIQPKPPSAEEVRGYLAERGLKAPARQKPLWPPELPPESYEDFERSIPW